MAKRRESPADHKGPMQLIRSVRTTCGWCLSQDCEHCKPELTYYDRIYVCGCKCQDEYVPQGVQDGSIQLQEEKKGSKDDLRDMQLQPEARQHESSEDSPGELREPASSGEASDGSLEEQPADGNPEPKEEREDNSAEGDNS